MLPMSGEEEARKKYYEIFEKPTADFRRWVFCEPNRRTAANRRKK
jgi:hypothetical protein